MSIRFQDLLSEKARKYGASEEAEQFQQVCIDACNYTLDDLENDVGISTTRISHIDQTIDLDAQKYSGVLSVGVDFYIQDFGQYKVFNQDTLTGWYQRKLALARRTFLGTEDVYGMRGDMS